MHRVPAAPSSTLNRPKGTSLRKADRDYRAPGAPVDWEANHARSRRLERIVDSSGLGRGDIAEQVGISREHLSRLLRSKTIHLGPRLEGKIEQAVRALMRQTRSEVKRCMRLKAVESGKDTARAVRLDRIIRASRMKRADIAREAGISRAHLSHVLRARSKRLGPELEGKIEQAIDGLQRRRWSGTYRGLRSPAKSEENGARVERINRIIRRSGLDRGAVAREAGITPGHLARLLRAGTTPLGAGTEARIEQAVRALMRQARSETRRCMRLNVAELAPNDARMEWLDRIIRASRLSQREIAGRVGISLSLFHHALRKKDVRLTPQLEARIEQAVWSLLCEARTEANRLLGEGS